MAHPRFSIVIPTYNRADLVGYTIQSVLNQTFTDFEIIVCDNCSTDSTAKVVGQYTDARIKYVRTLRHLVIADNWEFARTHATGDLIIMLGDDDALLPSALACFAEAADRHDADFLFCRTIEYRDLGFPGASRNTLNCRPFGRASRKISVDEFLTPLFSCRLVFDMHPSSFFFGRTLADAIAIRCGRFFQTNGVEYCGWPMAAVFAKGIALVDLPLSICGRTKKSWGSNMILGNPGKKRIRQFIQDVDQGHKHAPLTNFTMANLRAEGVLTAKALFPHEFQQYQFDEQKYLSDTWIELKSREALGVDVSAETQDLMNHLGNHPTLRKEMLQHQAEQADKSLWQLVRRAVGNTGIRVLRDRMMTQRQERLRILQDRAKVDRGDLRTGFRISGSDFGFTTIVGCANVVERLIVEKDDDTRRDLAIGSEEFQELSPHEVAVWLL